MKAPLTSVMAGWPSVLLGCICLVLMLVYVCSRLSQLKINQFRTDYVIFNAVIAVGTLYVTWWTLLAGQPAGLGQVLITVMAGTHLSLSHRPNEAFPPREEMRTRPANLDELDHVPPAWERWR